MRTPPKTNHPFPYALIRASSRPGLIGLALLFGGCAPDFREIDAKTDRVLRERVERLGGGAITPDPKWSSRLDRPTGSLTNTAPPSSNPGSEQLTFTVANEKRDVAARLAAYQNAEEDPAARRLDLTGVLRQAQSSAREYLSAEEQYILSGIRLLIERHRFDIRLFHSASTTVSQITTNGSRALALNVVNELAARKQLPFGGEVAARWIWDATDNLRNAASGGYTQSSRLVLEGNVPLLRGFGDVAQESLIQSERDLVYAAREFEDFRRTFAVSIARDYFGLLQQQDAIASQKRQLDNFINLENRQREWYQAGKLPEFEVNLATNNVLNARASLANQLETYILALDRFKVRMGIPVREPIVIVVGELNLPEPDTTLEKTTDSALEYRLDLQNQRDRLDDSKRAVLNARNALLPDLNVTGNATFPTKAAAREGGAVYEFDDIQLSAGIRLDIPLDRQIEKLQVRQSIIALSRAQREYDRFRDTLILDVRARTREIERARLNLLLAEERVKINLRRKEEQDLKPDEIDTQKQVDTANDLRDAETARDRAKADLRNAVLDYLLASGQLRVTHEGEIQLLPGMTGGDPAADPADGSGPSPDPLQVPAPAPAPAPAPVQNPAPAPVAEPPTP